MFVDEAAEMTSLTTLSYSDADSVGVSPVVPQGTSVDVPP